MYLILRINYIPAGCTYIGVDELSTLISSLSLSIVMLNIRSCFKNFNNFLANFCDCLMSFSCVIFTETWLTPERDKIFNIPGFYCYNIYRNHYGGGIKIYLKDCTQSRILENFTVINELWEILKVELFYGGFKLILMSVYHPPSACPQKNIEVVCLFTSYLRKLLNLKLPVIVAGDINLNLLNPDNLFYIDMFINDLFECRLRPLITRPTRVNPNRPTTGFSILDHIWVSDDFAGANSYVLWVGISDHFCVCSVLSALTPNSNSIGVRMRPITIIGRETFLISLSNISIESTDYINQSLGSYHSEILGYIM